MRHSASMRLHTAIVEDIFVLTCMRIFLVFYWNVSGWLRMSALPVKIKMGGLRGNQVLSRPITCRSPACRYACQNQRHYCEANESENWQEVIAFVTPKQQLTWYQEHGLCWIAFWYTCSILRDNDISIYLNMSVYGPTELKIAGIGLTVPPWHIHKFHRHVLVLVLIPLQLWNRTVNNGKYIY